MMSLSFKNAFIRVPLVGMLLLSSKVALAAGGAVEFINWYSVLFHTVGLDPHHLGDWIPVAAGLLTLILLVLIGSCFKKRLENSNYAPEPSSSFSLTVFVEWLLEFVDALVTDLMPTQKAVEKFFPLLMSLFLFIFISNISGLFPGLPPATESFNTNLAMGFCVFIVYNFSGWKEHGNAYWKHFLGPVWWMAPLMVVIEVISHLARPVSLSLRLYGNIFGDHLVLGVFTGLTYLVLPALLLFFGLLVASIQSFVFTLLSGIYISLAVSHDH